MKKIFYILILLLLQTACNDDFLERYPLSDISPENSFKSSKDLELFSNGFYNMLPGYNKIVKGDFISDNIITDGVPDEQTGKRVVPTTGGGWNWDDLRSINLFMANYERCTDEAAKKEYSAVARFFRAWFYFDKVKRFGDVPWYTEPIGSADEELLMKAKDPRTLVVENIIADLDYAIENLNTSQQPDRVSRWTALALKSRVCLFEGTFRKYHTVLTLQGSQELLQMAVDAAERVMKEASYSIFSTGNSNQDYLNLFASHEAVGSEVILSRRYSNALKIYHNSNFDFTQASTGAPGLTKSLVNSYLLSNGQPFTSVSGYEQKEFLAETQNRDKRLMQTIRTPGYSRIGSSENLVPDYTAGQTGYQVVKFVTEPDFDAWQKSDNDIPIIRYAEVLLNFAEAKAELGTLNQEDINQSVKLLRDRVGMPNLIATGLTADPVLSEQYKNANGSQLPLILEIRRERRIELALEGFRYDDLMRWKEGHLLANHFKGVYFASAGEHDLDGDGSTDIVFYEGDKPTSVPGVQYYKLGDEVNLTNGADGNLSFFQGVAKAFDEARDYLYPIPSTDRLLNPNLEQNPNWEN